MHKNENQQVIENKDQTVDLWMHRFSGWYSAIDRVAQNVKAKFVKMKSDIAKAIKDRIQERKKEKQKSTQEIEPNER